MDWFIAAFRKYAVFSGRARRREYWFFVLFYLLFYFGLSFLEVMLGGPQVSAEGGVWTALYSLFMLLPFLAVSVRRLHDTGRSGWWLLVGFIPIVGTLILLWFNIQNSQPGTNRFGPNPKETGEPDSGGHEWGQMP